MKKILASAMCLLLAGSVAMAQGNKKKTGTNTKTVEVTISSNSDEVFTVYIDGNLVDEKPSTTFTVKDLKPNHPYDLVVYIEKPIQYIASADFELSSGHYDLVVYSDPVGGYAEILFANDIATLANNYKYSDALGGSTADNGGSKVCSESEVSSILVMFSQEPFDDTRLHYVKTLIPNKAPLLCSQIQRIAAAFAYDKARVKFLKFAYNHCADKENYPSLADVLTDNEAKQAFATFMQDK